MGREGLARSVSYVDTRTKQEEEVKAKIIVVSCATGESARYPIGLANSNRVVGRYLHGHLGGGAIIHLRELEGVAPFIQDGATDHVYIPQYNQLFGKKDYAGGWGIQVNTVTVVEMNADGRLDIVSGENLYEQFRPQPGSGSGFIKHRFRDLPYTDFYLEDLSDFAVDVNGDGYPDLVSCSYWSKPLARWENPHEPGRPW